MLTIANGIFRGKQYNAPTRATGFMVTVVLTLLAAFSPCPRAGPPMMVVEAFAVVRPCTRVVTKSAVAQKHLFSPSELLSSSSKKSPTATTTRTTTTSLQLATEEGSSKEKSLKFLLDPGTKGGAVFLSILLFLVPIVFYNILVTVNTDLDPLDAGKWIGAGFTILATLAWVSTYIFRVATKDMTYAKQLKDYENAVIAKRLEELDEDELQALVEEVERDDF